ncbi:AraC-type DNA-binding protein [Pedobacter terrae]|uniref:AraC-type DNA-binding protein n=1 Tax=Pedobacter terrae TaxID=405671 RepID=A0A1G7S9E4_9SPHI|nr:AraC family transcriptional regulator [Pedobacter terrae]SDG19564.1 AraC-type DNA-binding protein [Pedobacter terrae]
METADQTVPNVLVRLARLLGTQLINRRLEIPSQYGSGYCIGFVFNEHIRMLISNYELNEDVIVQNPDLNTTKRMIFFKFQNIFSRAETSSMLKHTIPSVLIGTSRINTDDVIAIHTNTATITIEVDANYLNGLFTGSQESSVLKGLLQNKRPLLFEQIMYPSLQKIVDEITSEPTNEAFKLFFLRVKAEELICRLLMKLENRDEKQLQALNNHDIQAIYRVKQQILEHLETPPVIKELAFVAHMSPTKLKRLFRQIFGDSIFSYYQQFRMQEAALLLSAEKLSVSAVGYRMGFTNLSHFSRIFKAHIGMNPKHYALKGSTNAF